MSRHSRALQELHKRIEDGELGDILLMRGYGWRDRSVQPLQSQPGSDERSHVSDQKVPQLHLVEWWLLQ